MSQAFQGTEAKYPHMEKMAFSLIVASRKLRSYFQAHTIVVVTDQPIRKAMSKPDAASRMVQQAVELSQFNLKYRPRTKIKVQALANFIAEFTFPDPNQETEYWTVCSNGLSVIGVGGVGVIMTSLSMGFNSNYQQQTMRQSLIQLSYCLHLQLMNSSQD